MRPYFQFSRALDEFVAQIRVPADVVREHAAALALGWFDSTLSDHMKQPPAATARKLARLERAAVILEHVHDELRAMPASPRIVRLLKANRAAVEGIQAQTAKARTPLPSSSRAEAV